MIISTEIIIRTVALLNGKLAPDEHAILYGAITAQKTMEPGQDMYPGTIRQLGAAVTALRAHPNCPWCHRTIQAHSIDLIDGTTEIRCWEDSRHLPPTTWRQGPPPRHTIRKTLLPAAAIGLAVICIILR